MHDIRTFIDWLGYHPTGDEIARALVMEYMAPAGTRAARIGRLHSNDSLEYLGEYGFDSMNGQRIFPGEIWRSWNSEEALIPLSRNFEPWNSEKNLLMTHLRVRGVVFGYVIILFSRPVETPEVVEETLRNYAIALGLYLSLAHRGEFTSARTLIADAVSKSEQLTPRQISILRGMVEGKTNHDLASELGFSVSTIRHETMRIYEALAVSDRKEAAQKALDLSLV